MAHHKKSFSDKETLAGPMFAAVMVMMFVALILFIVPMFLSTP